MTQGDWSGILGLNEVPLGVAAKACGLAGIPVFPLFGILDIVDISTGKYRCECPAGAECDRPGKHPRVAWGKGATSNVDTIQEWWERNPNSNIGCPTGARVEGRQTSGWLVLDLDVRDDVDGEQSLGEWLDRELGPQAEVLWKTLAQRTGGGGKQLVYPDPGGVKSVPMWLPRVDIRSEGGNGYIVLPPSRHATGRRYAWIQGEAPRALPDKVVSALRLAKATGSAAGGSGADVEYDYRQSKVDAPPPGARDDFFNRYAFELRRKGWSKVDALVELRGIWDRTPGGGAPSPAGQRLSPYRWEGVTEKVERIWHPITGVSADPSGHEPVADELVEWARASPETGGAGGSEGDSGPPPAPPNNVRILHEPPPQAELATDLGTAIRYARVHRDRLRFVPGIGWIVWTGTHWQPDETGYAVAAMMDVIADIRRQAERSGHDEMQQWARWALACESAGRMFGIVRLAENIPQLVVPADTLDSHMGLICCPNGIVDLATGSLFEHRQDLYITNCTGVAYDPDATAALLDEFHATFLPNAEVAAYVYQLIGAALWGGNRGKRFLVITGDTGTGKSMWTSGVKAALGTYAASVNSSVFRGTLGDAPRPDLLHVVRKRLAIAEEGSRQWELHTDQVKRITGGDSIVARAMRSDRMIERVPDFTPLLVTNEMPHIKGADEAVRRRILALPFNQRVAREDITKKAEFVHDGLTQRALLALLVKGCMSAPVDADIMNAPHDVMVTTMDAFDSLDDVMQFVTSLREDGRLIEEPGMSNAQCASTKDMHNEYVQWVQLHGSAEDRRNRLGIKQFSQRLRQMGWEQVRSNGTRWAGKALGMTTSV